MNRGPSAFVMAAAAVAVLSLLVAARAFIAGQGGPPAFSNGGAAAIGAGAAVALIAASWPARLLTLGAKPPPGPATAAPEDADARDRA